MALYLEKYLNFTCSSEHKEIFSLWFFCEMVAVSLSELGGKVATSNVWVSPRPVETSIWLRCAYVWLVYFLTALFSWAHFLYYLVFLLEKIAQSQMQNLCYVPIISYYINCLGTNLNFQNKHYNRVICIFKKIWWIPIIDISLS